jgi:riboflavin kinase/FMN adenylyltransferase
MISHVYALEDLQLDRPACVSIGAFDGVHLGHLALLQPMVEHAHATGQAAVVITFYPHPAVVLRGRRPSFYLSTPEAKADRLLALGLDAVVTHPFNHDVANIRASDFVTRLLELARMRELWCGEDFSLGHNREGTVTFLEAEGRQRGFSVHVTAAGLFDGEVISSTRIRQTLRDGAVEQAARYLGRPFELSGQVVAGNHRGREIGFPMANLAVSDEIAVPANGVYACHAYLPAGTYPAVTSIGVRPTFDTAADKPTVEAHLLNFSGDLFGQTLTLDFAARLRPEIKSAGAELLRRQIEKDIEVARALLDVPPPAAEGGSHKPPI